MGECARNHLEHGAPTLLAVMPHLLMFVLAITTCLTLVMPGLARLHPSMAYTGVLLLWRAVVLWLAVGKPSRGCTDFDQQQCRCPAAVPKHVKCLTGSPRTALPTSGCALSTMVCVVPSCDCHASQ